MNTKSGLTLALIAASLATAALAEEPGAMGGAAVASEPGKAAAVRMAEITAQVVGLDKTTRTVTLKGPQGRVVDVVAGDEVKNFGQIKVGDAVSVRYVEALTLELRKVEGTAGAPTVQEEVATAKPGETPAAAGAREITAIAEVTAVDKKKSTITLKGPRGNSLTLDVHNPEQFKVVKKGDQVDVTYTEALAVSVEPAPAKKK